MENDSKDLVTDAKSTSVNMTTPDENQVATSTGQIPQPLIEKVKIPQSSTSLLTNALEATLEAERLAWLDKRKPLTEELSALIEDEKSWLAERQLLEDKLNANKLDETKVENIALNLYVESKMNEIKQQEQSWIEKRNAVEEKLAIQDKDFELLSNKKRKLHSMIAAQSKKNVSLIQKYRARTDERFAQSNNEKLWVEERTALQGMLDIHSKNLESRTEEIKRLEEQLSIQNHLGADYNKSHDLLVETRKNIRKHIDENGKDIAGRKETVDDLKSFDDLKVFDDSNEYFQRNGNDKGITGWEGTVDENVLDDLKEYLQRNENDDDIAGGEKTVDEKVFGDSKEYPQQSLEHTPDAAKQDAILDKDPEGADPSP